MAKKQQKKRVQKQARNVARQAAKNIVRSTAVGAASQFIGADASKLIYGSMARAVKSVRKKSRGSRSGGGEKKLVLSKEASTYLRSYISPFAQEVRGAHIPSTPSYPTYKVMGFIRGTGFIGTAGVGFVALSPCLNNDQPSLFYSTAAYSLDHANGPNNDFTSPNGTTLAPAFVSFTNLPYTAAQISSTAPKTKIEGRTVSVALRLQYTGTELNRSGMIYAYSDPDCDGTLGQNHSSTQAEGDGSGTTFIPGYNIATLSAKEGTEIYPVRKGYTQLVILPPNQYSMDFTNQNANAVRQNYPYSNGENIATSTATIGSPPAIIMVTGVAGQSFYFEAIVHNEYEGSGVVQSLLTQSESDVVGCDAVQNVLSRAQRMAATDGQLSFQKCVSLTMKREKVTFGSGKRSVDY